MIKHLTLLPENSLPNNSLPKPLLIRPLRRFFAGMAFLGMTLASGVIAWCDERSAAADLRYGGTLPGEISEYKGEAGKGRLIRVSPKLILAVPEVEIRRVKENDEAMEQYRRVVSSMPQTAEAHWEVSRWCNEKRLNAQRDRHLHRTIELDPNHGPARQLLGFEPDGKNGWVSTEALRRERGLVRDGGKWRYAEEVISSHAGEEQMLGRKEWLRKLSALKKLAVTRGGPKAAEAMQEINNINDPLADEAVAAEFMDVTDRALFSRHMWLETLGRLRTPIAINTIVNAAMNDSSPSIRERCYEFLNAFGKYQAVPYFVHQLKDKNNAVVKRAAQALVHVNDPEIALDLVDALVTQHTFERAPGNEMNIGMSRDGSGGLGGMSMGGKKVVETRAIKNPDVLSALLEVVPDDVNYQYDQNAWRIYFANKLSPGTRDLRRDP